MLHNGMGVMNCSPEFFKRESLCRQCSTPGLDIEYYIVFPGELIALLAYPRRVINSSPAFFKHEGPTLHWNCSFGCLVDQVRTIQEA
jgi:hypothetical protein